MTPEELKQAFRAFFDGIWNNGPEEAQKTLEACLAPDFTFRPTPVPVAISREDFINQVAGWHKAFPDGKMELDLLIAEGDTVACSWTSTGTHSDVYLGIPGTGKAVNYKGIELNQFADGKVQTMWAAPDLLTLMKQLGVIPA